MSEIVVPGMFKFGVIYHGKTTKKHMGILRDNRIIGTNLNYARNIKTTVSFVTLSKGIEFQHKFFLDRQYSQYVDITIIIHGIFNRKSKNIFTNLKDSIQYGHQPILDVNKGKWISSKKAIYDLEEDEISYQKHLCNYIGEDNQYSDGRFKIL